MVSIIVNLMATVWLIHFILKEVKRCPYCGKKCAQSVRVSVLCGVADAVAKCGF